MFAYSSFVPLWSSLFSCCIIVCFHLVPGACICPVVEVYRCFKLYLHLYEYASQLVLLPLPMLILMRASLKCFVALLLFAIATLCSIATSSLPDLGLVCSLDIQHSLFVPHCLSSPCARAAISMPYTINLILRRTDVPHCSVSGAPPDFSTNYSLHVYAFLCVSPLQKLLSLSAWSRRIFPPPVPGNWLWQMYWHYSDSSLSSLLVKLQLQLLSISLSLPLGAEMILSIRFLSLI